MIVSKQKSVDASIPPKHGTRLTPRTCLWPLAGSLVLTFALSIGLTFRSDHHCYAGTCGEWLFPLQARLHVVIWYSWISLTTTFLAVRAFHPEMQKVLARPLIEKKLPMIGKRLTLSGALMVCWIAGLYGLVVGVWWMRLHNYFVHRGKAGGIDHGGNRLAAVALTGHVCDITMGMVLLPISRHSALASFFKLSVSSTLTNHMFAAYTLFILVLLHAFLYVSWIPLFNSLSSQLRMVIPVLNPTYLYHETWPGNTTSLGIWRASLPFTGLAASVLMIAIFITTLPQIRSKHFNLFYFTHLSGILVVVIICLHASTMFYCTAPGLAMWFLDWTMRLHELRRTLDGDIKALGKGWYCVTVPMPRARLAGCSCRSPLAHFFIHHSDSSIRELHPFTTITHLATEHSTTPFSEDDFGIRFLFRKSMKPLVAASAKSPTPKTGLKQYLDISRLLRTQRQRQESTQWTQRLASLADQDPPQRINSHSPDSPQHEPDIEKTPTSYSSSISISIPLRLEGPYFSAADPSRYNTVICLVAGTGISGAIAIAGAFSGSRSSSPMTQGPKWQRLIIVWSVRAADLIELPYTDLSTPGLEIRTHATGGGRERLDVSEALKDIRKGDDVDGGGRTWVYISGPEPFIQGAKEACKAARPALEFYAASWAP